MALVTHLWRRLTREEASVLAAGIAFYGFLSILPGLLSIVVLYGAWADPGDVPGQLAFLGRLLPPRAAEALGEELRRMTVPAQGSRETVALLSLGIALWSAGRGIKGVMGAVGPSKAPLASMRRVGRALLAVALAGGALVTVVTGIACIVAIPGLLQRLGLPAAGATLVGVSRWPALAVVVFTWLAVLYRYGPATAATSWTQVISGAGAATLVWLGGSAAVSAFLAHFERPDIVYGSLTGAVALLSWLLMAAYAVLLGAEINDWRTARTNAFQPEWTEGERKEG